MGETKKSWTGQSAIVTGAGQGIGRAIALSLAKNGVSVVVNDINGDTAKRTVTEITESGGTAISAIGDISVPTFVQDIFKLAEERFSGPDILVNNAGIIIKDSIEDTDLERWNRILQVNLTAQFLTVRAARKHMAKQGYGRIVNISSIAAKHGGGYLGGVAYASTKAGVAALTRGAAREFAPDGITVNAVMPGLTDTPMTSDMPEWKHEKLVDATLVKRAAKPEEIARAVLFLAAPDAGFITGETIDVDGGTSLD